MTPVDRPDAAALRAAAGRTVPDVLAPNLELVFCGINPGLWSGAVGHHFARPGNRFWRVVQAAGFTEELLDPADERRLLAHGVGITNLVARATATAVELPAAELRRGAADLERRLAPLRPRALAVLGVTAYRAAFAQPRAVLGEQAERLARARVFVLANPSGAQARYQLPELVEQLAAVRRALGLAEAERSRSGPACLRS